MSLAPDETDPVPGGISAEIAPLSPPKGLPREQAICRVVAATLDQGRRLDVMSRSIAIVALASLMFPRVVDVKVSPVTPSCLCAVLVVALVQLWLAGRVALDAALFAHQARATEWASLDQALTGLGMMPAAKAGRPVEARSAGAMRLLWAQAGMVVLQTALMIVGALA